jgi:esterase/lipase
MSTKYQGRVHIHIHKATKDGVADVASCNSYIRKIQAASRDLVILKESGHSKQDATDNLSTCRELKSWIDKLVASSSKL